MSIYLRVGADSREGESSEEELHGACGYFEERMFE